MPESPSFLKSLLYFIPVLIGAPYLAHLTHHALPTPLKDPVHPYSQRPQLSEERVLGIAKYLSEEIGYRTVGSAEHAAADMWMARQTAEIKEECDRIVKISGRALECEVWRQQGSGSHRFDMAGRRLYKTYVDIPNHIVRISNGTDASKEHAVLINAHLDSTLPSPGAGDDALSVGIMLECIRVLLNSPEFTPKYSLLFLFNHAEESLQDGSHLYSTQHITRSTVRAVINLEAAGTQGRELLFQATSEEMIEAYSHVPRPFGTIFAHEVFSSGIILSDTDFRQFEQYLDVSGLDMAVVGHSYFYHTRKDLVENIQPGVAQNMAENTLALLAYLSSSPTSPLPLLANSTSTSNNNIRGDHSRVKPKTVFFSYAGMFWMYSFQQAKLLYGLLALVSFNFIRSRFSPSGSQATHPEQLNLLRGMVGVTCGLVGCFVLPNVVAFLMILSGRQMSWYKDTISGPLTLYGPSAALGAVLSQYLIPQASEKELFAAILAMQTLGAFIVQMLDIGSAALLFLNAAPMFLILSVVARTTPANEPIKLTAAIYAIVSLFPLYNGTLVSLPTLEVFVPLTGRIGASIQSDFLIATITSVCGSLGFPFFLPFVRRFNRNIVVTALGGITALGIAVAMNRENFSPDHPRRMFVLALEDMDTQQHSLHIGVQDSAPGMDDLAKAMHLNFGDNARTLFHPSSIDEMDSGWNVVYPFSDVLKPYQMSLPASVSAQYSSPWKKLFTVRATKDKILPSGNRSLRLEIQHTNVIWTVLSFEAHIVSWSLDDHPPPYKTKHYVREASYHKVDKYTIDLEVAPSGPDGQHEPIKIDFVGLQEGGLWPSKKDEYLRGLESGTSVSMRLFERLDVWLDEYSGGIVDATLLGTVKGSSMI